MTSFTLRICRLTILAILLSECCCLGQNQLQSDDATRDKNNLNSNNTSHSQDFNHAPRTLVTNVVYIGTGKTANLECGAVPMKKKIRWYKMIDGLSLEINETLCGQECGFIKTPQKDNQFTETLRIKEISTEDYKEEYLCKSGGEIIRQFKLRGDLKINRRDENGNEKKSNILYEGDTLYLYCNFSGLDPQNDISSIGFLNVSWFKDDKDITEDLKTQNGIFKDFQEDSDFPNQYYGNVTHDHRGSYKCSINLINDNDTTIKHLKSYPISYRFNVRVRGPEGWILPGIILLAEIIIMAIFTAVIWRVEAKQEESEEMQADSEDENENTKL